MIRYFNKDKKDLLFLLYILLLPFSLVNTRIGSAYRAMTIALFFLFMFLSSFKILIPIEKKKYYNTWLLYIGYSAIFTLIAGVGTEQLIIATGMLLLALISMVFIGTEIDYDTYDLIDTVWILIGAIFIILFMTGSRIEVGYTTRQTLVILGTKTDPNEFASVFVITTSVTLSRMFRERKALTRLFCILLIIGGLWVVLSSGSRGALLSVIVSLIVCIFVNNKMSIKGIVITAVVVISLYYVIFGYLIYLIPQSTLSRLTIESVRLDSGSGRSAIWSGSFREYIHGPAWNILLGYGYGGISADNGFGSVTSTMHNQFLQVLVSYGFVGFVFYIRLIVNAFRIISSNMKNYLGAYIGFLVMGLTITMGPSYKVFWIILMLPMLSLKKINELAIRY